MKLIKTKDAYAITVNDLMTELHRRVEIYTKAAIDNLEIGLWHMAVDRRAMANALDDLLDDIRVLVEEKRDEIYTNKENEDD